ncbi:MAG TPA: NADH-quinone oxidoreductase subunit L [Dehalococcoidia bacterium]|nr:NADH-quinone oxidoreductase subunit L [Dehalococcoidia bacterium]
MGTEVAFLAPVIPAVAFVLILITGRRLPGIAPYLSIAAIVASFVVWIIVFLTFLDDGTGTRSIEWFSVGGFEFTWGTTVDEVSLVMLGVVSFVAIGIQIYSLEYLHEEPRLWWYFAVQSLFAAAMMTLVLADNLLLLYLGWELVGLGSYLLIGFWWERRSAVEAAKKAFITTRIGDVALLIGFILLFRATGTFDISDITQLAHAGRIDETQLKWALIFIFGGAAGKSAQIPLHVWLPDAMEGPTPVSALIHAATMVVAGVYLVVRLFPIYNMVPDALDLIAVIGLLTALLAGVMALAMTDLKRILAYSTISHLGFMMLAVGAGFPGVAMFHLLTHAFAKASLFLGAGSISHGTGETDIREMGGLWRKMPFTTVAFWVGALSLAGLPLLSGFFSKDEILLAVHTGRLNDGFLVVTFVAVAFSVLYTGRLLYRVFLGQLSSSNEDAHEPGIRMWAPVGVFALLAAGLGATALEWSQDYTGFVSWVTDSEEGFHINTAITGASVVIVAVGLYLTWLTYTQRRISATAIRRRLGFVATAAERKFYFDEVYQWAINQLVLPMARLTAFIDRAWVNDIGVDGPGKTTRWSGGVLRYIQTGMVYNYALGMVIGAVVLGVIWWSV